MDLNFYYINDFDYVCDMKFIFQTENQAEDS